jgi:CRISPR-associated protein (TIGR03984 family)
VITLRGRAADNIKLSEVLDKCLSAFSAHATAMLYTPKNFFFGKLDTDGRLTNSEGAEIGLKDVFEARVFNENAELRWLNEMQGVGRAVLLSENDISAYLDDQGLDVNTERIIDRGGVKRTIVQTYLLWGQGIDPQKAKGLAPGWSRLTMARIGKLDVPLMPVLERQRVQLRACEYLDVVDRYGNIAVVEERLIKLESVSSEEDTNG